MKFRNNCKVLIFLTAGLILCSGCQLLFPTDAGKDLQHFDSQAPVTGAMAPNLELVGLDGQAKKLSDYIGDTPLVLQLGSHSCPVYRYRRFDIHKLHDEYAGRVNFLTIYTQEAHPQGSKSPFRDGEWLTLLNRVTGVRLKQPESLSERIQRAQFSANKLKTQSSILVDDMSNTSWQEYGGAASPAFIIDQQGRIVLRQVWIEPNGIRHALDQLLEND